MVDDVPAVAGVLTMVILGSFMLIMFKAPQQRELIEPPRYGLHFSNFGPERPRRWRECRCLVHLLIVVSGLMSALIFTLILVFAGAVPAKRRDITPSSRESDVAATDVNVPGRLRNRAANTESDVKIKRAHQAGKPQSGRCTGIYMPAIGEARLAKLESCKPYSRWLDELPLRALEHDQHEDPRIHYGEHARQPQNVRSPSH